MGVIEAKTEAEGAQCVSWRIGRGAVVVATARGRHFKRVIAFNAAGLGCLPTPLREWQSDPAKGNGSLGRVVCSGRQLAKRDGLARSSCR
jgi:hypothetical protein